MSRNESLSEQIDNHMFDKEIGNEIERAYQDGLNEGQARVRALEARLAEYERVLKELAGFAGKTLISMEHGQPYSEGANAAFEECAGLAFRALREGEQHE